MAVFKELKWDDPDVFGIVTARGVASVETRFEQAVDAWLLQRGYELLALDFAGRGLGARIPEHRFQDEYSPAGAGALLFRDDSRWGCRFHCGGSGVR